MAISTTFSNFLSLLSPPKPQLQFPLSRFPSHLNNNLRDKFVPLVATRDESTDLSMSSSSSSSSSSSAVTSSLSPSNNFLSRSPFNVQVEVEDDEPEEMLLNRFRREVMRAGIIQECKRRKFHENKQDEKKRKVREAAKRKSRARYPRRPRPGGPGGRPGQYKPDVPKVNKEEDDDNWDLPEEDVLKF